jgi:hypothetical protein
MPSSWSYFAQLLNSGGGQTDGKELLPERLLTACHPQVSVLFAPNI